MRVVAITRVLDEADVVEAFVRHTAAYVQHHVFLDNGSVDGTIEILRALKQEGVPLSVYQTRCVSFNEANHLTFLFRQAVAREGPDWVVCVDCDEFIDDRRTPGGLADMLGRLGPDVAAIKVPMVEYVATAHDAVAEPIVPKRIRRRREPDAACKIIARADPSRIDNEILVGGHSVRLGRRGGQVVAQDALRLAHYPERSPLQYLVKCIRGWNKVLAAGTDATAYGFSYHYAPPYQILRDQPWLFFRNEEFMNFQHAAVAPQLVDDPIVYSGRPLAYTQAEDEAMRAVRSLMGTVQELAVRHGKILDSFPAVKQQVAEWDAKIEKLL
jgi:hypothetical protein